jgi:bifunctional UDP-N-acetylglucosamine pyrophosphorylase/glucosamine-1-phosphate N-acetyltransferase
MLNGVTIIDPNNTYIGPDVVIGADTIIYPGNYIVGRTTIGENNEIKSNNYIEDSIIGDNNVIGPMTNIRPSTVIEGNNRIGSFVETKKATFKKGAKAAHLSYLGDAEIGEHTNIGGGTITANYDGVNKFKTTIGNNVFVGTGATIIAPITIADGAFIAGGSTVYKDIGEDDLVFGRALQVNKEGRAKGKIKRK